MGIKGPWVTRRMKFSGRIPWILTAWWNKRSLRLLVALLVITGAIDIAYAWMSMDRLGATHELNPAVRHFYQEGLITVWLIINMVASLFGGMILGSLSTLSDFKARKDAATGFGILLGFRFATTSIALTNYYLLSRFGWSVILAGFVIFLMIRRYLLEGCIISGKALLLALGDCYSATRDLLNSVMLSIRRSLIEHKHQALRTKAESSNGTILNGTFSLQEKRSLLKYCLVIFIVFGMLLGLLTVLQGFVFTAVPWRLRELGIVTEIQAQVFLIGFVSILVATAIVFYLLSSVFEIVTRHRED